jgi:hypothetical protein
MNRIHRSSLLFERVYTSDTGVHPLFYDPLKPSLLKIDTTPYPLYNTINLIYAARSSKPFAA